MPATLNSPLTAHFHWVADAGTNSPPPAQAIVTETCSYNWQLYDPDSGVSGSFNTDLGQTGTIAANTNSSGGGSKTFSVSTGGNSSFNVTFNPVGSFAGYLKYGCSYEILGLHSVVSAIAPNISLAVPDPKGHPEAGDGSNQFVYDNIVPGISPNDKGHLFLDSLVSAPVADLSSLITPTPQIDAVFDTALTAASGQPAGHTWVIGNNNLTVQTSHSTDSRVGTTHNQFVFFGLPANNSGFGNHQETLNYQGNPVSKANIQTFFLSKASNYPGAAADYNASSGDPAKRYWTPNWFHYYKQVYPTASSGYTVNYNGNTGPDLAAYTLVTSPFNIFLGPQSYPYNQLPVFALDETNPSDQTTKIKYIGYLDVRGLSAYIYVCEHERGHQKALQLSIPPNANPIYTNATSPSNWPPTSDGDNVVNAWEDSHHMDSTKSDTTQAYGPTDINTHKLRSGDIPDNEVIADIPALSGLFNQLALWKQDWAGGGILPDGTTVQGGLQWNKPLFFPNLYLTFHPVASLGPNYAGAWTYGPYYTVGAVSDIHAPAIFPNASGMVVLTAMP